MDYYALVAQLAEHIHGKDKVISSILIEGSVYPERITCLQVSGAAERLSDRGQVCFYSGKIVSGVGDGSWRVKNRWWS